MSRPLAPEEAALWARVAASAPPLHPQRPRPVAERPAKPIKTIPAPLAPAARALAKQPPRRAAPARRTLAEQTLDAGWDRRLSRGMVAPDRTIDLHDHTLASAHALLDRALARAIVDGARLLLLVTGRPPRRESERPHARGAIRAVVEDWIALSAHAPWIAAVRGAHPRHGGHGALYVVLRRARER